jgi:hypothetical protein
MHFSMNNVYVLTAGRYYVCMYVCVCAPFKLCVCVCEYVCKCPCNAYTSDYSVCMYLCMHHGMCVYVCMCMCVYVHVCVYVCWRMCVSMHACVYAHVPRYARCSSTYVLHVNM